MRASTTHETPDHRPDVGALGEQLACAFLERRGARVIARNQELEGGEIDILAMIGGTRVVVEVRTVTGSRPAVDAFGADKADRVWRLARRLRPPADRVDLIGIRLRDHGVDIHWIPGVA